ncbi:MAG: hypothetical protein Q9191_004210 [Dirinaria sp. TL-2023a]
MKFILLSVLALGSSFAGVFAAPVAGDDKNPYSCGAPFCDTSEKRGVDRAEPGRVYGIDGVDAPPTKRDVDRAEPGRFYGIEGVDGPPTKRDVDRAEPGRFYGIEGVDGPPKKRDILANRESKTIQAISDSE